MIISADFCSAKIESWVLQKKRKHPCTHLSRLNLLLFEEPSWISGKISYPPHCGTVLKSISFPFPRTWKDQPYIGQPAKTSNTRSPSVAILSKRCWAVSCPLKTGNRTSVEFKMNLKNSFFCSEIWNKKHWPIVHIVSSQSTAAKVSPYEIHQIYSSQMTQHLRHIESAQM